MMEVISAPKTPVEKETKNKLLELWEKEYRDRT